MGIVGFYLLLGRCQLKGTTTNTELIGRLTSHQWFPSGVPFLTTYPSNISYCPVRFFTESHVEIGSWFHRDLPLPQLEMAEKDCLTLEEIVAMEIKQTYYQMGFFEAVPMIKRATVSFYYWAWLTFQFLGFVRWFLVMGRSQCQMPRAISTVRWCCGSR